MTIESGIENAGAYIDDLDDTYPAGGDDLAEGDNHIRGIKSCLLNSFPAITGAVTSTHTELNYNDVTTIGFIEASKTVTADTQGEVYFDVTSLTRSLHYITGSTNVGLRGETSGIVGLYDFTNTRYAYSYNSSTNVVTFAAGITGTLTGDVTGDLTGNADTATTAANLSGSNLSGDVTNSANAITIGAGKVLNSHIAPPTAGTTYILKYVDELEQTTTSAAYPTINPSVNYAQCLVAGTVTVTLLHKTNTGTSYAKVMKNGVLVQEWNTVSTAYVSQSVNVSIVIGDIIQVQHKSDGAALSYLSSVRVYSNTNNFGVS